MLRCSRPEIAGLAGAAVITSAVITATVFTATGNEVDGPGFRISEFGPRGASSRRPGSSSFSIGS
ncbi:MAG TPA: hypothetical protein QGH28_06665 [Chloroflexota bacterium]|nr:hypothetical protein [Chloroflexota bacterium]